MKGAAAVDRAGRLDAAVRETALAGRAEAVEPAVRWNVVWGSFTRALPIIRFVGLFGGAWCFRLPHIATGFLGDHLIRPTAACVSGLTGVLGKEIAWSTPAYTASVRLDMGAGSLWISQACTPVAAWAIWVVFLIALPIRWRARSILLPAGLAALWILNTARLGTVLLLDSGGHHALAKTVHDHVWPWVPALIMIVGTWLLLRWDSSRQRSAT